MIWTTEQILNGKPNIAALPLLLTINGRITWVMNTMNIGYMVMV